MGDLRSSISNRTDLRNCQPINVKVQHEARWGGQFGGGGHNEKGMMNPRLHLAGRIPGILLPIVVPKATCVTQPGETGFILRRG